MSANTAAASIGAWWVWVSAGKERSWWTSTLTSAGYYRAPPLFVGCIETG